MTWQRARTDEPFSASVGMTAGGGSRAERIAARPNPLGLPDDLREALDSIESVTAGDPRDWAAYYRDAWLYGIVHGWGCEREGCDHSDPEVCEDAMPEVAARHGWTDDDAARLQRYRDAWRQVSPE